MGTASFVWLLRPSVHTSSNKMASRLGLEMKELNVGQEYTSIQG